MARVGTCRSPSFAPDGARIAVVSDLGGVPQAWTVATEGGWPEQVTALDDPVVQVSWSPTGEWLALSVAPGGGMNQQIYLVRPDGTDLRRLTDGGADNNWLGPWSYDGQILSMASNRDTPDAMDVYLIDVAGGERRRVVRNTGIGQLTDISRDGRYGVLQRVVSRGDTNLFLVDLADACEVLLTPHDGTGNFGVGLLAPDGRTIYLSSDAGRELAAFTRVRLDEGGQPGPIEVVAARDDAELEDLALSEDGTMAALIWNVGGRSELALVDLATLEHMSGPPLPGDVASGVMFSRDGRLLAIGATGAVAPPDIWVYGIADAHMRQLTRSPHPGVQLDQLVRPELLRFPAHDGLDLTGWLYRPRGVSHPGPLVISFHGGPEAQERPLFRALYQALLTRGIAVFAPNVRGSTGFGKTFMALDNGRLRVDAIRDIRSCVDAVVHAGVTDPARVGIMGGSYGGYMTMMGLVRYPELFAAGANLFGIVNFETFFAHTEPWMAAISTIEYGDPNTQADMLRDLSPIHAIDHVAAPTLVLHGANDTNVPVVEAEQVVERLRARDVPVEYVLFPDEGHGFVKVGNRIRSTVAIVRWFVRYLGGE